jgi:UDP-N-acetylglucosamine:LPS N-acetylglucosamine transferase
MVSSASSRRIVVISARVGAGHDGAAAELARRFTLAGFRVTRHDFLDLLPPAVGPVLNGAYKATLKAIPGAWEFLLTRMHGTHGFGRGALGVAKLGRRRILRAAAGADLIVSTYPLASKALGHLRAEGELATPVATFLTDMSVHPLWVHSGVDLHLALHGIAAEQARQLGAAEVELVTPAVRPEFAPSGDPADRATRRARFGLPAGPLALVVAGSWGVGEIEDSARDIAATGLATPVVACGRNDALRARITRAGTGPAIGWTTDMPALIRACDVVVQNAGGLTSLEALATGVPVLTYRCLPGHGRTNAAALQGAGWVPWVMDAAELPAALARSLATPPGTTPFAGTDPAAAALALVGGGTRRAAAAEPERPGGSLIPGATP